MNTKTLISNQKQEIRTYLDAFKSLPHNKATVFILIALPSLLWVVNCVFIWSPSYDKLLTASWINAAYNSFSYYNLVFTITTYAILVYLALSATIEIFRFDSFLEIARCTHLLKKVLQQTENAEEPNTCNYSFDNILFSDDVFSQCKIILDRINGDSSLLMSIGHLIKFVSFVIMTIGMGLVVTIPLSIKFSQCQLFSPVKSDLTMIFIVIDIIICIVCSGGLLLTTFVAQDNKKLINPLLFLAVFAGSILLSSIVALAIPGIIAVICWIVYGIITVAIALITAIIEIIAAILSGLFQVFIIIVIIAVVIGALSEL